MGGKMLRRKSDRASVGYPPVAESAGALGLEHRNDLAAEETFVRWQNRGFLRGWIKKALHILSVWVGFGWWESEDI